MLRATNGCRGRAECGAIALVVVPFLLKERAAASPLMQSVRCTALLRMLQSLRVLPSPSSAPNC
jgi:hypothetical protein